MAEITSYSHLIEASIPAISWDEAWFALLTWKGYLQSLPGHESTRISAYPLENGDVRLYVTVHWRYPEEMEEWRQSEWSAGDFLSNLQTPPYDVLEVVMEDFS